MLETAGNLAPAVHELPGALQRHVRSDRGDLAERQVLAIEMIATSLSRIADQLESSSGLMTYEEARKATKFSEDLLGKMVADGRLKQGRHYIRGGTQVRFAKNLVELIFEDQVSADDATMRPEAEEPQTQKSTPNTRVQASNNGRQIKLPKQNPSRTASKDRSGLDIDRPRRAS